MRDFRRVVVVAALGRNDGIASGARLQWAAMRQCGVEAILLDATQALRNPLFRVPHQPGTAYVFHSGAPQAARLISAVLPHAAMARRIGYWAWELPNAPRDWMTCDSYVDEVWTPSSFSKASLAKCFQKPIEVVPHVILPRSISQRRPGAPFTVLVIADSRSSLSRKNPEGAIRAFRAAFGKSPAARLVLKLGGRSDDIKAFIKSHGDLLDACNADVITGHLAEAELAALYQHADVLLSLHRAEGFGLPMREAMAHGLPVVGTGWSGNLEFMDETNSCLVPYRLLPVNDAACIYRDSFWAEPDAAAAAAALRRLATDPIYRQRIGAAAYRSVVNATPRFPFETTRSPTPDRALAML